MNGALLSSLLPFGIINHGLAALEAAAHGAGDAVHPAISLNQHALGFGLVLGLGDDASSSTSIALRPPPLSMRDPIPPRLAGIQEF